MYGGRSPSGPRDRGVGRRVDQRVHDRAGRPGQPGRPRGRQVGGIRQRVRAAVQLAGRRGAQILVRSGNVDADHGHRHRRAAGDGGHGLAGRGQPVDEHAVGQVEVGEPARFRVEHAQPGFPGAVRDDDAAVAEHRVRAHAQLPQRAGELLLLRAQRPGEGEQVSQVEVPPSGPVGDRVQAAVVTPDRSQHGLGGAPHDQLLLALVADRHVVVECRDPEFGAVPRHPGVVPADPGEPGAVRRRGGVGVEVRTANQDPDRGGVVRGRAVQRNGHDRAGDPASPLRASRPARCRSRTHHTSSPCGERTKSANRSAASSPGAGVSGSGAAGPGWAGPGWLVVPQRYSR